MISINLGSRKVQLVRGTFFVSLPRTWAKNFDVKKGTKVKFFLQDNGSLEISIIKGARESDAIEPI
jgi:phosphate uptake regulator